MECGVGIVFLLFALVALCAGVGAIYSGLRKQRDWRKTTGVVVDYQELRRDNQISYRPIVQFADDLGRRHVFATAVASQRRFYKIGESLAVIYSSEAPERAAVNSLFQLYGGAIIVVLLAAGFFGIGCNLLLR